MRACTICTHQKKAEIDLALSEGATSRAVAARFDLSKSAVSRHRQTCLAPKLAAAARIVAPVGETRAEVERAKSIASGQTAPLTADVLSLAGLVDRIGRSLNRLDGAADSAFADSSHTALAALSAQLHRGVETVARLQGLGAKTADPERPTFSISINLPPVAMASAPVCDGHKTLVPEVGARHPLQFLDDLQKLRDEVCREVHDTARR